MTNPLQAVLSSKGFWKYMCMCVFTVNLKSIFRHLDATLPKMQLRCGLQRGTGCLSAVSGGAPPSNPSPAAQKCLLTRSLPVTSSACGIATVPQGVRL